MAQDFTCRPYLTSKEEATRSRSTRLLSEVLGQLPEYKLTDGEGITVIVRVLYYCWCVQYIIW